jgi:flavocytochrome c
MGTDRRSSDWQEATDVLVVGAGFAGLAAAIEAAKAGADVLVLDKMNAPGGNSVISDGSVAAAGSAHQRRNAIHDSPDLMFKDMLDAGMGLNHPELARLVAENSAASIQWTIDEFGVTYQEKVLQFGGHSVPRTLATPNLSGAAIFKPQLERTRAMGVEIRTRSILEGLVMGATGSVDGVAVRENFRFGEPDSGSPRTIRARRAVILASGGFGSDVNFRSVHDPRLSAAVDSTNAKGATAEALQAAMKIGASTLHLSHIQLGPWASPDELGNGTGPVFATYVAFPYGVLVDPTTGARFVNEMADRKTRADAILKIGRPCIGIADSEGLARSGQNIGACVRRGVVKIFDTTEDLARAYSIPDEALDETILRFNDSVTRHHDEMFGKPILSDAVPLLNPPYYAMRHWPKVHYTMGGVRIDTRARVIGLDDQPIGGLYAAGEVTGGVHGACRLGSVSITECLVFGRIAGQNAAKSSCLESSRGLG